MFWQARGILPLFQTFDEKKHPSSPMFCIKLGTRNEDFRKLWSAPSQIVRRTRQTLDTPSGNNAFANAASRISDFSIGMPVSARI